MGQRSPELPSVKDARSPVGVNRGREPWRSSMWGPRNRRRSAEATRMRGGPGRSPLRAVHLPAPPSGGWLSPCVRGVVASARGGRAQEGGGDRGPVPAGDDGRKPMGANEVVDGLLVILPKWFWDVHAGLHEWLGCRGSNPDSRVQSAVSCQLDDTPCETALAAAQGFGPRSAGSGPAVLPARRRRSTTKRPRRRADPPGPSVALVGDAIQQTENTDLPGAS